MNFRRSLLPELEDASISIGSPPSTPPSINNSSPFDSSLALTILLLLTVLFFMAFFSLYIRRFSDDNNNNNSSGDDQISGRRQPTTAVKRGGGLDPAEVRVLPLVPYELGLKIWGECSICLSEFEDGEMVKMIPYCRHGFHPMCIDTWLSSHGSCPVCRSTKMFVDGDIDPTVVVTRS